MAVDKRTLEARYKTPSMKFERAWNLFKYQLFLEVRNEYDKRPTFWNWLFAALCIILPILIVGEMISNDVETCVNAGNSLGTCQRLFLR